MTPKPTPRYQYTLLPPNQIRLLRFVPDENDLLRCVLEIYQLNECPRFHALSYTWGSARFDEDDIEEHVPPEKTESILCHNGLLPITPNLLDACSHIKLSEPEQRFWIDAICINQDDQKEKTQQVLLMGEIFGRAEKVIVWLGNPCDDLSHFLWVTEILRPRLASYTDETNDDDIILQSIHSPEVSHKLKLDSDDLFKHVQGFYRFCDNHRWFDRIWTIQETMDVSKSKILCGDTETSFEDAINIGNLMEGVWHQETQFYDMLDGKPQSLRANLSSRWVIYYAIRILKGELTEGKLTATIRQLFGPDGDLYLSWLVYILIISRRFNSTDKRDELFAILTILLPYLLESTKDHISPDYSATAEDVYINFGKFIWNNSSRASLLSLNPSSLTPTVPSWVPDFGLTESSVLPLIFFGDRLYDAMNCSSEVPTLRTIEGLCLVCNGAEFGFIVNTCAATNNQIGNEFRVMDLLKFCCLIIGDINGVHPMDGCWRALTGNCAWDRTNKCDIYPAPQSLGFNFRHLMEFLIVAELNYHPERNLTLNDYQQLFNILDPAGIMESVPKTEAITRLKSALSGSDTNAWNTDADFLSHHNAQSMVYGIHAQEPMSGRRLFITSKGYLGMGEETIRYGDRVYFIRDSLVPILLRDQANTANMQLAGECYLYGFMNGEILEEKWGLKERIKPIHIS